MGWGASRFWVSTDDKDSASTGLSDYFFKSPLLVSLTKKVQNDGFSDDCWSDRWNQWEGFYRLGSPHLINPITSGCITLSLTALIFTHFLSFLGGEGLQCTMIPLSTRSCLKSNKLRPILNGQFYHAIFKNIGLNLFGSKQPREILVFVILKL